MFFFLVLLLLARAPATTPTFRSPPPPSSVAMYVDNGRDQTTFERLLTEDESRQVAGEILRVLGVPERPKQRMASPANVSGFQYLRDIYEDLADEGQRRKKRSVELYGEDDDLKRDIEESDIIMTFGNTGIIALSITIIVPVDVQCYSKVTYNICQFSFVFGSH